MTTGQKKFSFFSKLTASHSNPSKEFNKHAKNLYETALQVTNESNSQNKKRYEKINDCITHLNKYFNKNNFTNDIFETLISSSLIKNLSDIISKQIPSLSIIIFPFLQSLLFDNESNLSNISLNEEILLMNMQCISAIKILIKTFIDIASIHTDFSFIEEHIIPFTHILLNKFIFYPNFYYAISSDDKANNFDSNLFELIIQLFNIEFKLSLRESKSIIRKSLMKCLNLENFYTVNISLIERLLEILVNNLRSYYDNFVHFDISKYLQINKSLPKGASNDDVIEITNDDTIAYLKFFSMIAHCFAMSDLKSYLSNMLFNNFFCECVQKDIIALANNTTFDNKTTKILQFINYFTIHVNNYEICEVLFYFLFGFNYYNVNTDEDTKFNNDNSDDNNMIRNLIGDDLDEDDINEIFHSNTNRISTNRLKDDVKRYLRCSSNIGTFSSNVNLNIEKSNHNFESMIAYFTLIIESNNSTNKNYLLSILTNIARNVSYVFMTELVVPFYLSSLSNEYPKTFDHLCDKIKAKRDQIDIVDTLKLIHPRNFSINSAIWMNDFKANLKENYKRNINMLNRINTVNINSSANESMFTTANGNFITMHNITDANYSMMSTTKDLKDDIEFSPSDNPLRYMLNNYTVNLRIKFYDVLFQNFKKFAKNKYIDNLSYAMFFIEICSLPFAVNKGENGEMLYNIFSNVTYAIKKKTKIFKFSITNALMKIKNDLDEKVNVSFTREEIDRLVTLRKNELKNGTNTKNNDFFDNIILYNELYKIFLSNIFSKACIDQINFGWSKKVVDFNSNFE